MTFYFPKFCYVCFKGVTQKDEDDDDDDSEDSEEEDGKPQAKGKRKIAKYIFYIVYNV